MTLIIFDVNETLSDMSPLGERFAEVGVPPALLATWFASTLRDGSALSMAGTPRPFAQVARAVLDTLWSRVPGLTRDPDEASDHVLEGFGALPLHPDVAPGVAELALAGHRLVTLSNGARSVAQGLFARAGIEESFERLLSVEDGPKVWKPDARAYRYALDECGADDAVLVASHPWDLHGARQAGLRTAYLNRDGARWPDVFATPDHRIANLTELAAALA